MERLGIGDPRVEARGLQLFERIVSTGSVVLRALGETRAGEVAAQRWLSSPRVTTEAIVRACSLRTSQACVGRRVLAAQDTTEINFARWAGRRGLGPGGDGKVAGFFIHAVVAVDADEETVLGLVGAKVWTRGHERAANRNTRALEDKESIRWLEGAETAAARLSATRQVVVASDQEGDLWAHFVRRPAEVELLVRARHDRVLSGAGDEDEAGDKDEAGEVFLFAAPDGWPVLDTCKITIAPRRIGEKARTTQVAVRSGVVKIAPPVRAARKDQAELTLGLVEVREIGPVPAGAEPVLWRLLTTLPVQGAEAAKDIVRLYRLRWRIEEVFRALKRDGLGLEQSQVQQAEHLFRLSALALAAAVRILQLVDARDGSSRPMSDVIDQDLLQPIAVIGKTREGDSARQKNPHPEGSLAWLSWILARYGGWNCYGKPPGPKTMAKGWDRFAAILTGYLIANPEQLP
jgi:hypothetical protein